MKINHAADTLPRSYRVGVEEAALQAKGIFLRHAAGAGLRPGQKIRHVGKSGARWSVRYDVKGTHNPTALVRFTGPVHIVEGSTRAHLINAARARSVSARDRREAAALFKMLGGGGKVSVRRSGARALALPDGNFRGSVRHPGTPGKRFFTAARLEVERRAPATIKAGIVRGLHSAFR